MSAQDLVVWFNEINRHDIERVGGKNASLGEMLNHLSNAGIKVPNGFATTAQAYRDFLEQTKLQSRIQQALADLDINDIKALAATGQEIRRWIMEAPLPQKLEQAISQAWHTLSQTSKAPLSVAVRSSATAEDLPDASFAGQQETILNVTGLSNVLTAIKQVFASLYSDRAIAYRVHHGFAHEQVALSAGVQRMVRSDLGTSGVMFTIDTESGFDKVVFITAAYGLGEMVVQGAVNPDEYYVYKPALVEKRPAILFRHLGTKHKKMVYAEGESRGKTVRVVDVPKDEQNRFALTDEEVEALARQAILIEQHYGCPMDIEWVKDGMDNQLYIVQARPETVKSRSDKQIIERYRVTEKGDVIVTGRSIGQKVGVGKARLIKQIADMDRLQPGEVLVTDMTDPDWEPVMKRAAAIVTNRGGRTCHAAIIARELGIPAVVGCGNATEAIRDGEWVTVSCAEGDTGYIYRGALTVTKQEIDLQKLPQLPVRVMLNVGNPERAFAFSNVPNEGVGLARLEFIIARMIGVHPQALLHFEQLSPELKQTIQQRIAGYASPVEFYIEKLREGIATLAAAFAPKPVIVRLSDFKSNEYANLLGGELYEPHEENPMLGFRGASRYIDPGFQPCFELECEAIKRVRDIMGLTNVMVMVPFVRTLTEAKQVVELLNANGLKSGGNGLKILMMCELPTNALLAQDYLQYFDGFSIGSNDLTQLTLGLDRDSGLFGGSFDERDAAVKILLHQAIQACRKAGKYVGICGQGPSDHPDLARWLVEEGIETLSLNPDSVLETILYLAEIQAEVH